jgi:hypothetical protein
LKWNELVAGLMRLEPAISCVAEDYPFSKFISLISQAFRGAGIVCLPILFTDNEDTSATVLAERFPAGNAASGAARLSDV